MRENALRFVIWFFLNAKILGGKVFSLLESSVKTILSHSKQLKEQIGRLEEELFARKCLTSLQSW